MTSISSTSSSWSFLERIGFRFSFLYFLLFIIISNNGAYPFWNYIMRIPTEWMHQFIPWVGKHLLHLPEDITTFTNGSGDTTYDYVSILCMFVTAVIGAAIWSLLDRNRKDYNRLYYWLTVAMRYYVGLMLITYGLIKVVKLQFPAPSFYRLIEPYGESSPMGLAWTFLGFSKGYNLFMGIAEVAAVLLLFRRTLTFGLIITLMTTANVMAVNYFYDVPVKIISTHLFLMTLFLLLKDIKQLWVFFFYKRAVHLHLIQQPEKLFGKSLKWISRSLKILLLLYVFGYGGIELMNSQSLYGSKAPKHKLYGLYEVEHFEKNGDTLAPNITDKNRWRYLLFDRPGATWIYNMDNSRKYFKTEVDSVNQEVRLIDYRDSTKTYQLRYKQMDSLFSFETIYEQDTLKGALF